jgi:MFS family permease
MVDSAARNFSPSRYRIGSSFFFFISGFSYAAWASRIPSIQQQLHLSEAQLGSMLFALPVGLLGTMPLTNYLLGKYGSRSIMLFGAIFFSVMLSLAGFATKPWQLTIILLCFGSSRNLLNLSMNAQSVSVQALFKQSIITTFHGVWSMAGFAGAALGYLMVKWNVAVSWHWPVVGMSMLLLALFMYKNTLHVSPAPKQRKPIFSLPDKHLLKFSLIAFVCMSCENTMYDWSAIYFEKAVHSSKPTATGAFVLYMVAMTTGRFLGDKLVNRFGAKTILRNSGICITTGLFLAVLFPYEITAAIGFVLVGLGVACVVPLVFSIASSSKSISSASAIASISTVGYFGFLMVPPLVGFVAEAAGMRTAYGVIALLASTMIFFVSKIKEAGSVF